MKKDILIIALTIFLAGFISAATWNVPGDYATIQAAIDAVTTLNGDTINVAAGTYDEQVVIDGKSLTLQGSGDTTVIKPSSASVLTTFYTTGTQAGAFFNGIVIASIVDVRNVGTTGVTIKNIKVDGELITSLPVGAGHVSGIVFGETGGIINNVTVEDTKFVLPTTVRTYSIWLDSVGGTNVSVNVTNSTARFYGRNGINARGNNINVNFEDNTIIGPGSVGPDQVPNGILLIAGARGSIIGNTISANHFTGVSFLGSGVLLFQAGNGILVSENEIFDVDDAVLIAGTSFAEVTNNNLHDNVKGVRLEQSTATSNMITNNLILDNTLFGIDIGSSSGGSNTASENHIVGNAIGVNNDAAFSFNATYNWWGACDGPSFAPYNLGFGDSIVNATGGPVLFDPWIKCITDKVNPICAEQSKNITLYAKVNNSLSSFPIDEVWFSYTINGVNKNKTASNNGTNYSITINSSELIGGQNIDWNVYANDTSGFEFHNGLETFYVRNATFLGVFPFPADGLNGWWVTEPTFTLTQDAQTNDSTNNSWYQWDADAIFEYTVPFNLDDIPNAPPKESAGTLTLNWWTTFGSVCGNETIQSQTFIIDLKDPLITNLQPAEGSTVFNNLRPKIGALLDEVYQSNSGIDIEIVSMSLNGAPVPLVINNSLNQTGIDALIEFTPSADLPLGQNNVTINATDNAERNSIKSWSFFINTTAVFNMTIYSPENATYNTRRIPFNISLNGEAEKLEYINYNDKNPRFKILCRDCN